MRFLLACLLSFSAAATAGAADVIVTRRPVVIVGGAQDHAILLARRGGFFHSGCNQYEGIGFSTSSPEDARRRCCFFGRKVIIDEGVAWCPARRGWVAVLRYAP